MDMVEIRYLNDVFRRKGKTKCDMKISDILFRVRLLSGFRL